MQLLFDDLLALDMKEQELIRMKRDMEDALEGKRFLEDEVNNLRSNQNLSSSPLLGNRSKSLVLRVIALLGLASLKIQLF
jgi:hypothetical protein